MASLLSGGLARTFAAAFGGLYLPGRIHRYASPVFDDGGSIVPAAPVTTDCRVQVDAVTEAMRRAEGYTEADCRILILAAGLGELTTDDRVEVLAGPHAGLWLIASVDRDPAGAVFDCRGRRA